MKSTIFRILLTTAAAASVGIGCVNEEREVHDPAVELAFDPVMHVQVRSETGEQQTSDEADSFGVSAWHLDETTTWSVDAESAEPVLDMEPLVRDGALWYPQSRIDWPAKQYRLNCIGFAPFEAVTTCSPTEGVVFDGVDTSSDPGDLRYSEPQTELAKSRNGGVITLPMIPALCEIDFCVKGVSGYDDTNVYVRHIAIDKIAVRGSFHSLPDPTWTLAPDPGSIDFFDGDTRVGPEPLNVGEKRRVIPQETDGVIVVDYEFETPDGNRLHQVVEDLALKRSFEAGRHYTITLAVSPAGVEVIVENPSQIDE